MTKKSMWIWGVVGVLVAAQFSILKQGDSRGGSVAIVFKTPYPSLWKLLPVDTGAFACARIGQPGRICEGSLAGSVLDKGVTIFRWGA